MNRPKGKLLRWATDAVFVAPGKPYDGATTRIPPGTVKQGSGWKPDEEPAAVVANALVGQLGDFLVYLDLIDVANYPERHRLTTDADLEDVGGGTVGSFRGAMPGPAGISGGEIRWGGWETVYETGIEVAGSAVTGFAATPIVRVSIDGGKSWERRGYTDGDAVDSIATPYGAFGVLCAWSPAGAGCMISLGAEFADNVGHTDWDGGPLTNLTYTWAGFYPAEATYDFHNWNDGEQIGTNIFPRTVAWVEREGLFLLGYGFGASLGVANRGLATVDDDGSGGTDVSALTIAGGTGKRIVLQAHSAALSVVADNDGRIFTTDDFANAWADQGTPASAAFVALLYSETYDAFFAVTAPGAVWRSTDGTTWTNVGAAGAGCTGAMIDKGGVLVLENKPGAIYVLQGSTDAGATWDLLAVAPAQSPRSSDIAFDGAASSLLALVQGRIAFCTMQSDDDSFAQVNFPGGYSSTVCLGLRT